MGGRAVSVDRGEECPAWITEWRALFNSYALGLVLPERAEHARSIATRVQQQDLLEVLYRVA